MDAREAADAIRADIDHGFANRLSRDASTLTAILKHLSLADSPASRVQVALLLEQKGIVTAKQYPKILYLADDRKVTVWDEASERKALQTPDSEPPADPETSSPAADVPVAKADDPPQPAAPKRMARSTSKKAK